MNHQEEEEKEQVPCMDPLLERDFSQEFLSLAISSDCLIEIYNFKIRWCSGRSFYFFGSDFTWRQAAATCKKYYPRENKESHNFLIDNNLGCPTKLIYLYVALVLWNSTLIIIRNYIYIYLLCFTTIYVKFIKTNSCNMKIFVLFYYVICQRNYAHYFKFIGLVRSSLRRVIKTQEEHKSRLGEWT